MQQLRNATPDGVGPRLLIRDRDDKFGSEFDRVAGGAGSLVDRLRNLGHEVGRTTVQYLEHYHRERNHQGLDGKIIDAGPGLGSVAGRIESKERLGGMLRYYYRQAA